VTNAQAYRTEILITTVKCFRVQAHGNEKSQFFVLKYGGSMGLSREH